MTRADMERYGVEFPRHGKCKGPEVTLYLALKYSLMPYGLPSPVLGTGDSKTNKVLGLFSRSSQHMEYVRDKQSILAYCGKLSDGDI